LYFSFDHQKKTGISMKCYVCGWKMTWVEYSDSFRKRQLNPGGAVKYFKDFIKSYEQARTPKDKMLAIDRVIHEFHYSLREMPDQPTRATGVNLINGKLTDIIIFLDELGGMGLPEEFCDNYKDWRGRQDSICWEAILRRKREIKRKSV